MAAVSMCLKIRLSTYSRDDDPSSIRFQPISRPFHAGFIIVSCAASELLEEALPPDQRERFLANIRTEAERLQNLIEQLLALSSIESRKRLDNPQPLDAAALVRRIVDDARLRAPATGASIDLIAGERCPLRGDEFLLETAIGNLVRNAVEFSPRGGRVAVGVRREYETVRVSVEDEGPGLPDYALARVFDRFYSLPRPSTGRKSSGLGLCFVREAVELHRGSVTLRNRADAPGAIAELTLPASI